MVTVEKKKTLTMCDRGMCWSFDRARSCGTGASTLQARDEEELLRYAKRILSLAKVCSNPHCPHKADAGLGIQVLLQRNVIV